MRQERLPLMQKLTNTAKITYTLCGLMFTKTAISEFDIMPKRSKNMNCNKCKRNIKSTAVAITGTAPNRVLTITIPSTVTLNNLEDYRLVICQTIPSGSGTIPVQIMQGTTAIPFYCRKGNIVRADQLHCRCAYPIVYGNDPVHLSMLNCIPQSGYSV